MASRLKHGGESRPSVVEEDDNVVVSLVDFGMALQFLSERTEPSTVGTLELRCCDRCCSVALFESSGKALASLFFKLCCSSSGDAAPVASFIDADSSWSGLMSHRFKFSFRQSLNRLGGRPWLRLPDTSSL